MNRLILLAYILALAAGVICELLAERRRDISTGGAQ